jgi:hypothetical protein
VRNVRSQAPQKKSGTTITLDPFLPEFASHCPSKASTIKAKIIGHFVSYFVNMHLPKIIYRDEGANEDLFDVFSKQIEKDQDFHLASMTVTPPIHLDCILFYCRRPFRTMRKAPTPSFMALIVVRFNALRWTTCWA